MPPEGMSGESVPSNEVAPVSDAAPAPTTGGETTPSEAAAPRSAPSPSGEASLPKSQEQRNREARETFIGNVVGLLQTAADETTNHNNHLLSIHAKMKDELPPLVVAAIEHLNQASGLLGQFVTGIEAIRPEAQEAKTQAGKAYGIAAEVIGEGSEATKDIVVPLGQLAGSSNVLRAVNRPRARAKRYQRKIDQLAATVNNMVLGILPQEELGTQPVHSETGEQVQVSTIADSLIDNYTKGNGIVASIGFYQNRL